MKTYRIILCALLSWLSETETLRAGVSILTASQAASTVYVSNGSNVVAFAGPAYAPRVGEYFGKGSALVLPFQLPTLAPGAQFSTADFKVWLYDIVGQTNVPFSVDLYGLAARGANSVLASDFYAGAAVDPAATLLQSGLFTPGTVNGHGSINPTNPPAVVTSGAGDSALVSYLNEQYNSGAGAGSWIFLRLSPAATVFSGNYAYTPLTSSAGESYAHPVIEYTSSSSAPPAQTNNQTINLIFPVQGLAYAKLNVSPAPLSVSPVPSEGVGTPSVRNPVDTVIYQYTFASNTLVTISKNQFTGSEPNTDIQLSTVDYSGQTLTGQSVSTLALDGANWNVQVYSVGSTNPTNLGSLIPDPYQAPAAPALSGSFRLVTPTNLAMVTDTRSPTLRWAPVPGAVRYDVYLNLSLTNYDWMAPGALLDRFSHLATASNTSYALPQALPDRWTYNWYVVATDASGNTNRSDLHTFGLYLPAVTTVQDGIPVINGMRDLNRDGVIEPYEDWHNPPAMRAADLLSRMTLHEKAMQLFFNAQVYPDAGFAFGPFQAGDLFAYQLAAASNRLGIPFLSAGDTIHGFKTTYPTQPGLAATRDLDILWAVADVQRRESVAIGYRGTLSPLAEVGTKMLYPRIQEGGGEDADLVAGMMRAMIVGLQGGPEVNPGSILITTKHWPGQGAGGESGVVYDGTTIHYHMRPWHAAIEAGTSAVMPGYAGCALLGPEGYGAGDNASIIGYLRTNMNFKGLICTDWLPSGNWVRAAAAGSDVMGGADPAQMGTFETDVAASRIDESALRVLELKFRMGIFEDPYGANLAGVAAWHTPQNVAIVHQAAVESLTLLKNDGALPLRLAPGSALVVAGPRANDPSCMVTWRSDFHNTDFGSKTIYQAIVARAAQEGITVYSNSAPAGVTVGAAIVVVGESYYTHGTYWDKNSPWLPDDPIGAAHDLNDAPQYGLIQAFRSNNIPTTTICLLPRPYVLTNVCAQSDALMVVYRPGDEGGPAIAETLFGDHLPMGKTPWQLPLSITQVGTDDSAHWSSQPDKWDLPFDMGATAAELASIRTNIAAGLPVPPTTGQPLFQYGSGIQGFGLSDATPPAMFNLLTPADGLVVTGALPVFTWEAASDPETGIARYEIYLDGTLVAMLRKGTSYTLANASCGNGAHSWQVKACNWAGGVTGSATFGFTISDSDPPAAFLALFPANGTPVTAPTNLAFCWEQSTDAGTGIAGYTLQLDGAAVASVNPGNYVSPDNNLALGKPAYGSSTSFGTPSAACDGDLASRWSSDWLGVTNANAEWFTVDLGGVYSVREVVLKWEAAYGKEYLLQVSNDGIDWTTICHKTGGTGGVDDLAGLSGAGRYVRMQGVTRGTGYGYSLWEFQVFGLGTEQVTVPVSAGTHNWQVQAVDGAGNARSNSNGALSFSALTGFMWWQLQYFGSTNNPQAAATADADGTGQNNAFKYVAGLNPTNPAEIFTLRIGVSNSVASLSFGPVMSNRLYSLQASTNLPGGSWDELWSLSAALTNRGQVTLPDAAPDGAARFYRVRIALP